MPKTPTGTLRAVMLLIGTAGCAEMATVLGDGVGKSQPSRAEERSAESPSVPTTAAGSGGETGTAKSRELPAVAGITAAHNRVRATVDVPPLEWSPALAEVARRWANACVDRVEPRGMIDHSAGPTPGFDGPVGENLYATTGSVASPSEAVAVWAAEAKFYDHSRNACTGGPCGHYTQIVWRTTRQVGCAVGTCPRLEYRSTLVCNYAPAGNIVGQRPY